MASTFARLLSRAASSAGVLDFFSTPDGFFVALDEGDGERDDPDEEEDDEEEDDDEEESESELEELEELDDSSFLERFLAIAFGRVLRHLVPKKKNLFAHTKGKVGAGHESTVRLHAQAPGECALAVACSALFPRGFARQLAQSCSTVA